MGSAEYRGESDYEPEKKELAQKDEPKPNDANKDGQKPEDKKKVDKK